ncbi:energy-coupling factor ABC transporter permease [Clostridium algidicarnis]|uniref:energy-coupling factor ABC transporter permease n=1 Tax=Clostridium algidicarnis TaxID=37659 RepID=UPI001C0B9A1D|nr:energy-coupling factor ABC transporter permease [Clostridium algidicarnis]MBU3195303.1 energy-coupling factor ABC transporter permease [Clostridium algidicarnis]MBU3208262.1 energy-coupling factor ABC transporter permease [Clostridium algidicarnis]MBU3227506.1 energy-coupling factor ABC transporter permease [Clostridium algidicarnis]MBU3251087.1 energy-coupling factor ABC transporter permease [Clostridium algidicarnis]
MKKKSIFILSLLMFLGGTYMANAMHIVEGFLSPLWCVVYFALSAPFFILGIRDIKSKTKDNKDLKMLLALVAAYAFVLSAMKLPSVSGSSSHPTGTGLGAILFGPYVMSVVGSIVLLFQAIFLAHGGITTLGANVFSMGIVGPIISYVIYRALKNKNKRLAVFLAAALGDLVTYIVTSLQLGLAFPATDGGVLASFIKFIGIFAITQIPLAVIEGILTVGIFEFIEKHSNEELISLGGVK